MTNLQPLLDLFDSPQKWTKGEFARDDTGHSVGSKSEFAVSWCLMGGVQRCYGTYIDRKSVESALYSLLPERQKTTDLVLWNDRYATFRGLRRLLLRAQRGQK